MEQKTAQHFHFILMERYQLLSLVSALEVLQNANYTAERSLFTWSFHAPGDTPVSTLGSCEFPCVPLETIKAPSEVVIVGGTVIAALSNAKLNAWLARHVRQGVRLSALATGAFVLASAGMAVGEAPTLHWQFRDTFRERFPEIELSTKPYVAEGNRCSSSGGVSAIDLFLRFVADYHGEAFATRVSESMNYVTMQQVQQVASAEASARSRVKNPAVLTALEMMEGNLEHPITPPQIAQEIGVSTRQLERLFNKYLGQSPKRYYMHLRLRRAYFLLTQTNMPVIEVALACGFQSAGHFAKCFRAEFGQTPTELLKAWSV
ncbi:GlxA family transcriptional regulator [Tropicibacter sp. R15_0]|uniref:GlxA family transcriptional regulator n=1 Tax=Tropicibacter sp. R15_0 TaxID=2821101 RepID=UPI001AD97942|nr:GlxA family transcriptional regulator [Tropicibacter sp. R15_0]